MKCRVKKYVNILRWVPGPWYLGPKIKRNMMSFKKHFPIFNSKKNRGLIYLDSAATTQKPQCVIDAEMQFYTENNANIHRGVYQLSERATNAYEQAREKVAHFINAEKSSDIIFTRGTTESINLVAHCFGLPNLRKDDEIILSVMEHHSNIVPWQMVCEKTGARLNVIPLTESGALDFEKFEKSFNSKTKLVAMTHVSNVLGVINPVKKIIDVAHQHNVPVLLDGAQAVAHLPVNVQALDCDFYAFSSHKIYGPTGVGVLYAKTQYLESMPPYQTGGDMIRSVTFDKTEFNVPPQKFEAGTPNMAGVVGLGAAIDFVTQIGFDAIQAHEKELLKAATEALQQFPETKIYGTSVDKLGVIAFGFADIHPHDIATILDQSHIAVRAGHHCAMPLMDYLKVPALSRVSFGLYNELSDVDALGNGLKMVREVFGDQ